MSLVISNNMMAANTARILGNTYDRLSTSVQRLSSGLRINSAADDAAGLAIRELMRADIAAMQQGIRNAADGISLLQTAEGGMAVIDEKLVRMRELAEQAATGTYTTVQREIINSEYQAMAAEIDRIATATNFNGVKLLDGSLSNVHYGMGLKLHFGVGNDPAEDYYFVQIGDVRATTKTGLRVGGDAKNDIWGTVGTYGGAETAGCCGGGFPSLNDPVPNWHSGEIFSYGYNWDWVAQNSSEYENGAPVLRSGRYIAGAWQADASPTLQELLDKVNEGTQARVRLDFEYKPPKFTLNAPGYPPIDLTAWSAELSTTCPIDKNYVITGLISAVIVNSASPPLVCFGDGLWPPKGLFNYNTAFPEGWVTAAGSAVTFNNFASALSAGVSPSYSYTIISAGVSAVHTVNFSAANQLGAGLIWSAADHVWYDTNFIPNPAYKSANVIADSAGNYQYVLTHYGAYDLTLSAYTSAGGIPYASGDTLTSAVALWLTHHSNFNLEQLLSLGLIAKDPTSGFVGNDGTRDFRGNPDKFPPSPLPVYPSTRPEVRPVFALTDGQLVPESLVQGDSVNGFKLKLGQIVQKSQAGGITLADLLGKTSAANPKFSAVNIVADNDGNHHYSLLPNGSNALHYLLSAGGTSANHVGLAVTSGFVRIVTEALKATGVAVNGLRDLLTHGYIGLTSAFGYSASNVAGLVDFYNQYPIRYDTPSSAEGASRFCLDDEIYYVGSATLGRESYTSAKEAAALSLLSLRNCATIWNSKANPFGSGRNWETIWAISALAFAVNNNVNSKFWARLETGGPGEYREGYTTLYVYSKEGGDKHNLTACDEQLGDIRGNLEKMNGVVWYNDEVETATCAGTYFNNGGKDWAKLRAIPTGYGSWGVQLHGRDVGKYRDLWILNVGEMGNADIQTDQKKAFTGKGFGTYADGRGINNLNGLDRTAFMEIQNAADGPWAGAHVRTQSDAQESLDAIRDAIERKDKVRATLGAYINRLENTITNLEIQAENLQASESRISDVDMATEMTTFVRNQVLTQAAVSMLGQANSLPQMALSLLNG